MLGFVRSPRAFRRRGRRAFPRPCDSLLISCLLTFWLAISFATIILFMKVLMAQQGFDKPFTGGLGSYKLYVLVAYHVSAQMILWRLLGPIFSIHLLFCSYPLLNQPNLSWNATSKTEEMIVHQRY